MTTLDNIMGFPLEAVDELVKKTKELTDNVKREMEDEKLREEHEIDKTLEGGDIE